MPEHDSSLSDELGVSGNESGWLHNLQLSFLSYNFKLRGWFKLSNVALEL
jgi:hypothetical protein